MPTTIRYAVPVVVLVGLTGCATNQEVRVGTENPCETLQALIADYPNGFESFRGKGDNFAAGTVYRATTELIAGHCQIWSWGGGDSAYLCSVTNPSLNIAKERHERALQTVESCLGEGWQEQGDWRERAGETDGYASRFYSTTSNAVVSIETTVQVGGPGRHFTNFLYIGNADRADLNH